MPKHLAVRLVPPRWRWLAARWAYLLGGELSRIKVPQRFYSMDTAPDGSWVRGAVSWRRSSWGPSNRLLTLSMRLDWEHWDHWALVHDRCAAVECPVCGSLACPEEEYDDV